MAKAPPFLVGVYMALARRCGPVFRFVSWLRRRSGKEDPLRAAERFGQASKPRPEGGLVWVHAASVGETASVLPLIDALVKTGRSVVLTTVTRTSADLAAQRLPAGAFHQFACYDNPSYVERFLAHWRPDLALVVESEVWPSAFVTLRRRAIPLVLVNGRMSEKSFAAWRRVPRAAAGIFGCASLALAQSEDDAKRLQALGLPQVAMPGNLKFDGAALPVDPEAAAALKAGLAGRPCWLAALTHPGEDEMVLATHARLLQDIPGLLLFLVPRHPERAAEVAGLCEAQGMTVSRRSEAGEISAGTSIYLGDTIGEMGLFYDLCQTVFLGGSFAPVGGHNPLEVLRAGGALISGPNVFNARTTYQALWQAGAAQKLSGPDDLTAAVRTLLRDEGQRKAQAEKGQAVIAEASGALSRTLDALTPYLERSEQ